MRKETSIAKEILIVGIGVAVLTAAMLGVFALLGRFDGSVLLGGLVGAVLSFLHFLLLVGSVQLAADKAEKQDVRGGKTVLTLSRTLRYVLLFGVLVLCALTKAFHPLALVLPVLFVQPVLMLGELFRK